MRIVFVITGTGAGGAEKNLNLLARHRQERGDEVILLCFTGTQGESYFSYPPETQIETFEPPNGARGRSLSRTQRRFSWLRARLTALRPDLVVSFLTKNNVLSLLATIGLSIPVIISERNNTAVQLGRSAWRLADIALSPRAARLVLLTEAARARLPVRLRRNAIVIPNSCSLPEAIQARPGAGRVVAVGRLDRQKGFDLLLGAFARVVPTRPEATLTIFGEGPERAALERQIRDLGLTRRVALPGVTDRPGGWIEHADIFTLTSRYEGFANVLAEAIAAGLPSIAFDCDFGPSTILDCGTAGLLVPVGDVDALAAGLGQLLDDPALRAHLRDACPKAAARFTPDAVLAKWDAVIAAASRSGAA